MNVTPSFLTKLDIVFNNYEMFGFTQTVKDVCVYLLSRRSDDFDARHGVRTSGRVEPCDADISDAAALDGAIVYEPTDEHVMRHILDYVAGHLQVDEFTFVDLGCGKGRAVLMASELPFREVIGVEVSPSHCERARRNVADYARARGGGSSLAPARIVHADATCFEFPESDLMIYLYNPFHGSVLRAVLDGLSAFQQRTQRRVVVASSAPVEGEYLLRDHPAFMRKREFQVIWLSRSWALWECHGSDAMYLEREGMTGVEAAPLIASSSRADLGNESRKGAG